jgi:hypothetical protein
MGNYVVILPTCFPPAYSMLQVGIAATSSIAAMSMEAIENLRVAIE